MRVETRRAPRAAISILGQDRRADGDVGASLEEILLRAAVTSRPGEGNAKQTGRRPPSIGANAIRSLERVRFVLKAVLTFSVARSPTK
jgi:hypothetical protein